MTHPVSHPISVGSIFKVKKLTGITGATQGSNIGIAHGLDRTKIMGIDAVVTEDGGNRIPRNFIGVAGFQFDAYADASNVIVLLSATNSASILSGSVTVLLTYEA